MVFQLSSTAFVQNGEIPKIYTCEGADKSPPLAWSGVPAGAKSLVLIVDDPDAPDPGAHRGRPRRARPQGAENDLGALGAL